MRPEILAECRAIFRGAEQPKPIFATVESWRVWFLGYMNTYTPQFVEQVRKDQIEHPFWRPSGMVRNGKCTCCVCRVGGTCGI